MSSTALLLLSLLSLGDERKRVKWFVAIIGLMVCSAALRTATGSVTFEYAYLALFTAFLALAAWMGQRPGLCILEPPRGAVMAHELSHCEGLDHVTTWMARGELDDPTGDSSMGIAAQLRPGRARHSTRTTNGMARAAHRAGSR